MKTNDLKVNGVKIRNNVPFSLQFINPCLFFYLGEKIAQIIKSEQLLGGFSS